MRIYVDFDDVLCETARALCELAATLFGCRVNYEDVRAFDLKHAFGISDEAHAVLMAHAHEPTFLCPLDPTPHAVAVLADWRLAGHDVWVVTGRPFTTRDSSAAWLAAHGLPGLPVTHVDKYGREPPVTDAASPRSLNLAEFRALHFDVAVEDAPPALELLRHDPACRALVFDRPWNRRYVTRPPEQRCRDWREVAEYADQYAAELRNSVN